MAADHDKEHTGGNPLEYFENYSIDPLMLSVLEDVAETQQLIHIPHEVNWEMVSDILSPLNRNWEATRWPGTTLILTGKLRIPDSYSINYAHVRDFVEKLRLDKDTTGEYYEISGQAMVCSYFIVGEDSESNVHEGRRIGLSLVAPGTYEDVSAVGEGDYIIYPEDIAAAEFDQPSYRAIEQQIKYYFPDLYQKILELFPVDGVSDIGIAKGIKSFAISGRDEDYHGYPIVRMLSDYLFHHIDFDDDYYEVTVDGAVRSINTDGEVIESDNDSIITKYRGRICGIRMEVDGDTEDPAYRPGLIMAIPKPEIQGDYYVCLVPAESLVSLHNLRSSRTRFGKQTLMSFEYPGDVRRYVNENYPANRSHIKGSEEYTFSELMGGMEGDFLRIVRENE